MIWETASKFSIDSAYTKVRGYYGIVREPHEPKSALGWTILKLGSKWAVCRDSNFGPLHYKVMPESVWPTLKAAKAAYLLAYATGQMGFAD